MTRAQRTISLFALVAALYFATLFQYIPIFPTVVQEEIIPVLPFWALTTFGAYLLSTLGYNLLTFNDVPAAHASLMKEIEVARGELRGLGVDVD